MKNLKLQSLTIVHVEQCVDVFIHTFSKEPWFDTYDSREQVKTFFINHLQNNYFLGYIGLIDGEIVALSIGMIKPWIKGLEYYIDEFCISYNYQGKGLGSQFLQAIEKDIEKKGLNAIILNTEKGFPAEKFYMKNGFNIAKELIILTK